MRGVILWIEDMGCFGVGRKGEGERGFGNGGRMLGRMVNGLEGIWEEDDKSG